MRILLILTVIFLFPNYCLAQQNYVKIDLEETEYLYPAEKAFLKKTGKPLEGNYELKINPYQKEKSTYINGLKNGTTEIYRNKKLSEVGLYHNDLREGEWKYYNRAGDLWKLTYYQNGLREGVEKIYSKGKVIETIRYKGNHKID